LFVVLLVVLSLLLAAGTVTFVNTIENYRAVSMTNKERADNMERQLTQLRGDLDAEKARSHDAVTAQAQITDQMKAAVNQANQFIADRDLKNAQLASQFAMAQADTTRLAEALKASEDTKAKQNEMIVALRQNNDQAVAQTAQMSQSINDLTNRLEVTERERRNFAEQLEQFRGENQKLSAAIRDAGLNVNAAVATAGHGAGAPKINGVIRDVRMIAGRSYGTISVGSADAVIKGMEFKIVDRTSGNFLGILTVQSVEPNEATGQITGPNVAAVKPGVEVRTQL